MEFLIKAAQLILSISIIVVLHELGHFLPAKWFKVRVEKFYLFFDPWFSLFKVKKGETEYGIGWLPLGGYVKLVGMVDESMDTKALAKEPEPYEFRAKPAWQRLIIMTGGVIVNLILGAFIYAMIMYTYGVERIPVSEAKYGYSMHQVLLDAGFKNGDVPLKIGDESPRYMPELTQAILSGGGKKAIVLRDGKEVEFYLDNDLTRNILAANPRQLFSMNVPFIADTILSSGTASKSELIKGDRIFGIGNVQTPYFVDFVTQVENFKGEETNLTVIRGMDTLQIAMAISEAGRIGVGNLDPLSYMEVERETYTFFQAIPKGVSHGYNTLSGYVKSLPLIFTKEGAKNLGGFGTIGSLFPSTWNWQAFWEMTAFISIILGFMNILPIPALDGGHVMFLLYEMITGRPANQKILENAQVVGMVLLLALMVYANGNDIFKLFNN
ncbi:MAG: RIP metalloprotease RseP [Luteibaculaceae bacterium]